MTTLTQNYLKARNKLTCLSKDVNIKETFFLNTLTFGQGGGVPFGNIENRLKIRASHNIEKTLEIRVILP